VNSRRESEKPALIEAFAEIVIEVKMEIGFDHYTSKKLRRKDKYFR
jgi:hypothetical protein